MRKITKYIADKQGFILGAFLTLVMILFIGILVMVYVVSKRANPIMLDETGKPINSHSN